jgi:hypothetical protein
LVGGRSLPLETAVYLQLTAHAGFVVHVGDLLRISPSGCHLSHAPASEWKHHPPEDVFVFHRVGCVDGEHAEDQAYDTGRVLPDFGRTELVDAINPKRRPAVARITAGTSLALSAAEAGAHIATIAMTRNNPSALLVEPG